jgi:predicted RNA polymerase sigma factor
MGRFHIEAAIGSVHCSRAISGNVNWQALTLLYEGLTRLSPSTGALVARAIAIGHSQNPQAGLYAVGESNIYQPALVARAHLHNVAGKNSEAIAALDQAIEITKSLSVRNFLVKRRQI